MSALVVASYGGGINSTAMLVGMIARGEQLDLVVFGDTGGEKPETYAFLRTFDKWLRGNAGISVTRVQRTNQYGTSITLEAELHRTAELPSIAFGGKTCSDKFKIQPFQKFMNHHPEALAVWSMGERVTKLVGYHAGEKSRVDNATKPASTEAVERDRKKYELRFPLVEWKWDHDECVAAIEGAGLPVPPKSACFFCPSSKRQEIVQLRRKHPDLYERAIAIEDRARPNLRSALGLGRRFSWKDVEAPGLDSPIEEPCGCWDGESEDAA